MTDLIVLFERAAVGFGRHVHAIAAASLDGWEDEGGAPLRERAVVSGSR